MWQQIRFRLGSLWCWRSRESELDEEFRVHLAEVVRELVEGGMSPAQARLGARRDFGNLPLIRERTRETWGWGAAERLLQDARSAIRALRRNPGYACAVVLTLALGIGLNASMYTLLSRLFLQAPPHIEAPDEVHRMWVEERFRCDENGDRTAPLFTREGTDWADYRALGADFDGFGAVAGYTRPRPMLNGRGQRAEELQVSWVTGELLALLGARPALGRPIVPEDDDVAAEPVAVIGNGYWKRRFAGTREALGAALTFGEITYTIVGVMPPGFAGPEPHAADVWLPLHLAATDARENWRDSCAGFSLTALLRLAPGATAEAAEAAATSALRAARADSPWQDTEGAVVLGPVLRTRGPGRLGGDMLLPLVVGGVAGIVLLIAGANVTNLLMLRVAARRRELAVRQALGAGRWAVGRLLVIESLVLATLSGGAALALAAVASRVLRTTLLPEHQWAAGPLDATAVAFTGVAALVVGLATAVAPAVYAARSRGIDRLDGLRGARSLGAPVRTGLIVVQAALSLVLLNGAATFYGSFDAARKLDVGYAKENLLTVQMGTGWGGTPLEESAIDAMEARVRSLPGVLDVAQTTAVPMTMIRAGLALRPEAPGELPRTGGPYENFVTENYFRVAGLDLREGRGFTERDRAGAPRVAVVNSRFARLVWPDQSAVGRCLFVGDEASACTRVVGVTETALEFGVQDVNRVPHFYLPIEQASHHSESTEHLGWYRTLVVRTDEDPGRTVPAVLRALAELFPELPANRVRSLPAVFAPRIRSWTVGTGLFGAAAVLALLLAALGLYAVIAFGVRQRELEFGIRRALGARAADLLRMVMARGLAVTAVGVCAGAVAALAAGRFVAPLLFDGRSPRDPLALTAAVLVLMAAATGASFLPARRATRADPRRALQSE
ncbi:MAG: ADOP family duplicated permease [Acidobacteria bacterium]|nr:ADOP family duplicated permease [Acidobacteriota bacterium]